MAIKVSGTEVISDSRALNNIASVDATTAASINAAGVGGGATHEATASGALANGDLVIVNSDGTVSVVEETTISESLGSATVFETGASRYFSSAYDSNSDKVVIVYQDENNSDYGTAVVGTISGTSISFGTPVVFNSGFLASNSTVFDSSNNKIVIAYQDSSSSDYGQAIVGTVSGTSISFGSEVTFKASNSQDIYATFDSSNNKVVVVYSDAGAYPNTVTYATVGTVSGTSISFGTHVSYSGTGVYGSSVTFDPSNSKVIATYVDDTGDRLVYAKVGTVSGTSISFGSATQAFGSLGARRVSIGFDSNANKAVLLVRSYFDNSGYAAVGTVSGTSISFGTAVQFGTGLLVDERPPAITFDTASSKIIIAYGDDGNSKKGTYVTGSVSGTSITFSSPVIYMNNRTETPTVIADNNGKAVLVAQDFGSSERGTARVLQIGYAQPNLTSGNYIGISDGAYSDTATATVQVAGAVDDAQTGLTVGQAYYVQTDGTLSTTPDDPSVFAGTALSSTELLVKV